MTIHEAINIRLQGTKVISSLMGEFAVADLMMYSEGSSDTYNTALLTIEGELQNQVQQQDRAVRRKEFIKKTLSKALIKKIAPDNYDDIKKIFYFSYDSIYNVDYCYFVDLQTYAYDAFVINRHGHILVSKSYEISEDYNSFEIYDFTRIFQATLMPTKDIDNLFRVYVNMPILSHPQSNYNTFTFLGYDSDEIRSHALKFGRANFDESYKNLTPSDKVSLYCFFNMKKHYFSSFSLSKIFFDVILSKGDINNLNFVDIGCGPLTSGLAFIELLKFQGFIISDLNYYGVDISNEMLKKAKLFSGILKYPYNFHFFNSIDEVEIVNKSSDYLTIINSSYLFASENLDAQDLSTMFNQLYGSFDKVFLLYQNPSSGERNSKWEEFKEHTPTVTHFSQVKTVKYKNRRTVESKTKTETVLFEVVQILTNQFAI